VMIADLIKKIEHVENFIRTILMLQGYLLQLLLALGVKRKGAA